jgi:hypothetical protein
LDEHDDVGSADGVEPAVVAQGDLAGLVDAVVADSVVGIGSTTLPSAGPRIQAVPSPIIEPSNSRQLAMSSMTRRVNGATPRSRTCLLNTVPPPQQAVAAMMRKTWRKDKRAGMAVAPVR